MMYIAQLDWITGMSDEELQEEERAYHKARDPHCDDIEPDQADFYPYA